MSENKKPAKCPVTFYGNKIINDNLDLNYLMIAPYHSNLASSITRSFSVDELKKNGNPSIVSRAITHSNNVVNIDAINSYIKMNIGDIVINKAIALFSSFYNSISLDNYNQYILKIKNEIDKMIDFMYMRDITVSYKYNMYEIYPIVDAYIESIFSSIVVQFNNAIEESLVECMNSSNYPFDTLYEYKFEECFGVKPDNLENIKLEDKYTFLSSVFREIVVNEMYSVRNALSNVGMNICQMIIDSPDFHHFINDKSYTTADLLDNIPEMSYIGCLNCDSPDNPTKQIGDNNGKGN